MNMKKEMIIISGFMGFSVGVCSMMMVNIDKEWMNEDIFNGQDSTIFDDYIYNLEQMCEENRNILYKIVCIK